MTKIYIMFVAMCIMVFVLSMSIGCIESSISDITPEYKMIEHREPVYATLMTVELDDVGDGDSSIIVNNVYDLKKEYTGTDFWGNSNYNVEVFYYIGLSKASINYYEINSIRIIDTHQGIVGYETWTEKVRVN